MKKLLLGGLLVLALVSLSTATARADFLFDVSVNTSGLNGSYTAPFGIDFQLLTGGAASGNTATIRDFNFGVGGSPSGSPSSLSGPGTASGDLSTTVTLTTSPSLGGADFNQGFTPGSTLSFQVDLTTNVGTPTPDSFTFFILQNYSPNGGTPIPTSDILASSLLSLDITSDNPTIQTFAGANNVPPAPTVTPVPEPGTLILFAVGLASLTARRGWKRRRETAAA